MNHRYISTRIRAALMSPRFTWIGEAFLLPQLLFAGHTPEQAEQLSAAPGRKGRRGG